MDRISIVAAPLPVIRITSRIFPSNAYLVRVSKDGGCLLVDPGLDSEAIAEAIDRNALSPRAIICTHGHFDHLGSAAVFQDYYDVPVYLSEDDFATARSSNFLLMAMKIDRRIKFPTFDHAVRDGFCVTFDKIKVEFHAAPGHTPGSCIVKLEAMAFTGDTLYSRGVGLSGLPGENTEQLKASIKKILGSLSDETIVMPGHGGESTLGDIKRSNLALRSFMGSQSSIGVKG